MSSIVMLTAYLMMVPGSDADEVTGVHMEQSVFYLPIKLDAQARKDVQTLRLWTSTNRGKTWHVTENVPPAQKYFTFRAPRDGLYWFNVQTISKDGGKNPPDISKERPALAVLVKRRLASCRLALGFDGKTIATAGEEEPQSWSAIRRSHDICLRNGPKGTPRFLSGHTAAIVQLEFSPDKRFLASAGRDGTVRLWDIKTGRQGFEGKHKGGVAGLAFSPDGTRLVSTGSEDGKARLWQIPAASSRAKEGVAVLKQVAHVKHPEATGLAAPLFSSDGKHVLIAAGRMPALSRWDFTAGKQETMVAEDIRRTAFSEVLALSSDERTLIGIELDKSLSRRGEVSWAKLGAFPSWQPYLPHKGLSIVAAAVGPDGRCVAIANGRSIVSVWELATGQKRCQWDAIDNGLVRALAFSRDCRRLAGSASDQLVSAWDMWPAPKRRSLEACWTDLSGKDARSAFQAIADLAGMPESVPFLNKKLRENPEASKEQIHRWVRELDTKEFRVRDAAQRGLRRQGGLARPALQRAAKGKLTLEARMRIQKLLDNTTGVSGFQLQVLRAVEVLERSGSSQAMHLLRELAEGGGHELVAIEARNVVRRVCR